MLGLALAFNGVPDHASARCPSCGAERRAFAHLPLPSRRVAETIAAIRTLGGKTTPAELAREMGIGITEARTCFGRALAKGFVTRLAPGTYALNDGE